MIIQYISLHTSIFNVFSSLREIRREELHRLVTESLCLQGLLLSAAATHLCLSDNLSLVFLLWASLALAARIASRGVPPTFVAETWTWTVLTTPLLAAVLYLVLLFGTAVVPMAGRTTQGGHFGGPDMILSKRCLMQGFPTQGSRMLFFFCLFVVI